MTIFGEQLTDEFEKFVRDDVTCHTILGEDSLHHYITAGKSFEKEQLLIIEKACHFINQTYKLEVNINQIRIIDAIDMVFNYASIGMPLGIPHWSNGKSYLREKQKYDNGGGLAFEIVINSSPTIVYVMDSNTLLMQLLVIAHAGFGHNTVYKGNYLFKDGISPDVIFAEFESGRNTYRKAVAKYGIDRVQIFLDALYSIQTFAVTSEDLARVTSLKYDEFSSAELRNASKSEKNKHAEDELAGYSDLVQDAIKHGEQEHARIHGDDEHTTSSDDSLSTTSVFYFLEKESHTAQKHPLFKELIRHVRIITQYFYPQRQCKVLHEAFATFWHHQFLNDLYDLKFINSGAMLEFIESHSGVIYQPDFDHQYYSGWNPYALGFPMCVAIKEAFLDYYYGDENADAATKDLRQENYEFYKNLFKRFPKDDSKLEWVQALEYVKTHNNDESFIRDYLPPSLVRTFKMFCVKLSPEHPEYAEVVNIHNEKGYRQIRNHLADEYALAKFPTLHIVNTNADGDDTLDVEFHIYPSIDEYHAFLNGDEDLEDTPMFTRLHYANAEQVIKHLRHVWGETNFNKHVRCREIAFLPDDTKGTELAMITTNIHDN